MNHFCCDCEEWRPVVGYEERYAVSSCGRVLSLHPNRGDFLLRQHVSKHQYLSVRLYLNKQPKRHTIHRLVLAASQPKRKETRKSPV